MKKSTSPRLFSDQRIKKLAAEMFATSFLHVTQCGGSLEYFELFPDGQCLRSAFNPQLGINIADMTLCGGDGDKQFPSDILIGTASFYEPKHFYLTHGQWRD